MGENGSGKTTLEQAFTWCLYGKHTFAIAELVNREARDIMVNGEEIGVYVELEITHNKKDYKIYRKQIYSKKNGRLKKESIEPFFVYERDDNGDYKILDGLRASAMVQEFLPVDLSDFFFFDGERLASMSDELLTQGRSSNFKGAVRGLVGLSAMLEAIEHLGKAGKKSTVIGKFDSEIDDSTSGNIADKTKDIDRLSAEIDNLNDEISKIEPEINRYEQAIVNGKKELRDMQDSIANKQKYDQFKRTVQKEEEDKVQDTKDLFKYFAKNSGDYFSIPLLRQALEEVKSADKLDKGIPYMHADTVKFLLERGICVCGTKISDHPEAEKHLKDLMVTLPPNSLSNTIAQFTDQAKSRTRSAEDFYKRIKKDVQITMQHQSNIERSEDEMRSLEKRLPNQERVNLVKSRIMEAGNNAKKLKDNRYSLGADVKAKEREIKRLEGERESIRLSNKQNRKNMIYLKYAQALADQITSKYKIKEEEVRVELESKINRIFEDIYDGGIEISVNDRYNVSTIVTDTNGSVGDELEKNTAQSYAIIFAFIAGIIEMAKKSTDSFYEKTYDDEEGFPLVMDAPLSAFDKDRIQRICTVLPGIANQVIIFIKDTEGEIAEEYMNDIIGKKWLIGQETKTRSIIEERM